MLEAKSLRKAVVPSTLIEHPSPGNLQSTRLALHASDDGSSCWAYVASGCHVYKIQMPLEDAFMSKGKESLLIPVLTQAMDSLLVNRCPHRSEIQSIVLTETESTDYLMLGSVDSYGHLIVSKLDTAGKDVNRLTYSVLPRDNGVGEGSWAGLCFSPSQWSMDIINLASCMSIGKIVLGSIGMGLEAPPHLAPIFSQEMDPDLIVQWRDLDLAIQNLTSFQAAVARSFCKTVDVYDQDIHVRTLRTLWYPSSLNFIQNPCLVNESSILAVTEGFQLTIWDLRMKENGGCIQRVCGAPGDILYAVCSSSTGNIAVGGADRTVTIYDPRRWSALSRWVHCSKYEITGLAFSSIDPDHIYIQGVDYEVFCGHWKEGNKVFSFRGDSNWLGFSKCSKRDVLGGWCDSGSIFVADVVAKESETNT